MIGVAPAGDPARPLGPPKNPPPRAAAATDLDLPMRAAPGAPPPRKSPAATPTKSTPISLEPGSLVSTSPDAAESDLPAAVVPRAPTPARLAPSRAPAPATPPPRGSAAAAPSRPPAAASSGLDLDFDADLPASLRGTPPKSTQDSVRPGRGSLPPALGGRFESSDSDLPAALGGPRASRDSDLPAALGGPSSKVAATQDSFLPAALAGGASSAKRDLELPTPLDLPEARPDPGTRSKRNSDLPAALGGSLLDDPFADAHLPKLSAELPSPRKTDAFTTLEDDGLDLPSPAGAFGGDFDSADALTMDGGFGHLDLPVVGNHEPSEPPPKRQVGSLPPARGAAVAGGLSSASFGALPAAGRAPSGPPLPGGENAAWDLDDLGPTPGPVPGKTGVSGDEFGSLPDFDEIGDLDGGLGPAQATKAQAAAPPAPAGDGFGDDDLFDSPSAKAPMATQTGQAGSTNYGEVSLGGGGGLDDLDDLGTGGSGLDTDDGMEFGGIPQEETKDKAPADPTKALDTRVSERPSRAAASAQVERGPAQPTAANKQSQAQSAKKNRGKFALAAVLVTAIAGGALALVPAVGPFGIHVAMDLINRGQHDQLLSSTIAQVQAKRSSDLFTDARSTLELTEQARTSAERFQPLTAYSASLHYALVLRYGSLPEAQATAKVLLDTLVTQGADAEVRSFSLAVAAQSAVNGDFEKARTALTQLKSADPNNLDILTLLGEVELAAGKFDAAKAVWTLAVAQQNSAWTQYGLARSLFGAGDATAKQAALAANKLNPKHAGAMLLLAELSWQAGDEATATGFVDQVLALGEATSVQERVAAHTLLAEMHLTRGRMSKAEGEFALALELDPKSERALVGLGNAFFQAGRHAAALARFEAAVSSAPESVVAKVGVAKSQLALEKLDDAKQQLTALVSSHPKDPLVLYWFGKAAEASDEKDVAKQSYEAAASNGGQTIHAVNAYVALAQLLSQAGDLDGASQRLMEAAKKMPDSALLHKALGDVALSRGNYEEALAEYKQAEALDKLDIGATFKVGSSLRRLKRFEEAWAVFEQVAKVDKDLPGLPLERGLLLEESGKSDEALKEYEAALSKSPDDLDLMLRVGCGRMTAGNGKGAAEVLRHVLTKRPKSAETSHCLGRALSLEGQGLEALRFLQQAASAESNRAEYHLYVGWVANELGQVAVAQEALDTALKLDQGLAEAHWQQGVLLLARGAATESTVELKKALELKPSRHEVHADLAQAYYQLGNEVKSMEHWALAIAAYDKQPTWLFRYGKLLNARGRNGEAATLLIKSIELSEGLDPRPSWLWQAHQLAASSLGVGPKAASHWRKFLEMGPEDSPYRDDAKRALAVAGDPWKGN